MADLWTAFDACCEYTEEELARFIEELQQRGYYDPEVDVLIITADHGEVLDKANHQMLGHVPPVFWEDIVRVPLIIGHPQWPQNSYSDQVSLLDLKRIILDTTGINSEYLSPDDLTRTIAPFVSEWEELHEDSITTYRGVRRDDGKKLFGAKLNQNDSLVTTDGFDGTTERVITNIPFEKTGEDLLDWENELLGELSAFGDAIEFDSTPSQVRNEVDKQHLKNLGYLE
jgi:arylsulfatase A-like enzyme